MYLLGEKLEEAVEEFLKANELNPTSGLVLVQKLYAEYRLGISKNDMSVAQMAINCLQNAITKFPNTPEGYMLLAQVCNLLFFIGLPSYLRQERYLSILN